MDNSKEPGKKKIKDEDLGTVSGGCGKKIDPKKDERFRSKMRCINCNNMETWDGDWSPRWDYHPCPDCKQQTMHCIKVIKLY